MKKNRVQVKNFARFLLQHSLAFSLSYNVETDKQGTCNLCKSRVEWMNINLQSTQVLGCQSVCLSTHTHTYTHINARVIHHKWSAANANCSCEIDNQLRQIRLLLFLLVQMSMLKLALRQFDAFQRYPTWNKNNKKKCSATVLTLQSLTFDTFLKKWKRKVNEE